MRLSSWIRNLFVRPTRPHPVQFRRDRSIPRSPPVRIRLGLEHLEARLAPAVFNVNSLADILHPGPGIVTLRSAIVAANNTPGGNAINLMVPGTYSITLLTLSPSALNPSGDFDIQSTGGNLTIANTSGGFVAVNGGFHSRVFDINADNVPTPFTVTFRNFTIQNGDASPGDGANGSGGGAVFFAGSGRLATGSASTLINDTFFANSTLLDGGALGLTPSLSGTSGDLLLLNATINGNTAGRFGGGIADGSLGILWLQNTLVSGNTAGSMGQDIFTQVLLADGGGNLLGAPGTPGLTSPADKFGPPKLFPLNAINGGPTAGSTTDQQVLLTEFPMPQSLAIGNGVSTGAPTSDERGFPRPALSLKPGVSIGAVEPGFIGEPSVTFVLQADHQIYGRKLDAAGNPTGGYYLTAPGQFSAIAVTRLEGAGYEVFGIGQSDGQVHAEVFDNAGNGSGFFLVQPGFYYQVQSITVGNDASGLPLLVAIGMNNQVAITQFDPSGNPVGNYTTIGGAAVQSVTMAADASGNPELFAIGSDNQVYYAHFDAAGNPLTGLVLARPGQVSQIAVGADASGNPELFAIMMSDSQVYALKFDAAGNPLGSYQLVQAGAVKQIAVGMDGYGDPELFVILLSDSQVYALKFDASGNSVGNYVLTQPGKAQSIAVGFDGGDHEELFAVMADNQVYEQFFDANGNSTGAWTLTAAGQVLALAAPHGH